MNNQTAETNPVRSREEVARDMAKAVDTAVATYQNEGMSGLANVTQECYEKSIKNLYYCVYLDVASRHIDQIFVESMNFPPHDYFSDAQFGPRILPVLVSADMDMNTANQYLASVTLIVDNMLEEKLSREQ